MEWVGPSGEEDNKQMLPEGIYGPNGVFLDGDYPVNTSYFGLPSLFLMKNLTANFKI